MKIETKDIKKYLSTKGKFVATGKYLLVLSKHTFLKVYGNCKNKINAIREKINPDKETIEETRKEKIEAYKQQREELKKFIGKMENDDDYRIGVNNCYLQEIKKKLRKLDTKQIKISKKGLSGLTITGLAFSKIKENIKNKWAKHKEKIAQEQKQKEEEKVKQRIQDILGQLKSLEEEKKAILKDNMGLDLEDIKNNFSSKKVTGIKKVEETEKEKIKKSNNFKKAIAGVLTLATLTTAGFAINKALKSDNKTTTAITQNIDVAEKTNKNDETVEFQNVKLGDYLKVSNGSLIYSTPELNGKCGSIGLNGYTDETLFKVNAVTYIDENNNEVSFNLVQKSDEQKQQLTEKHNEYIRNNPNIKIKNFHITPCNEYGIPTSNSEKDIDLGGWTNATNAGIKNVDIQNVIMNTYESLGGKSL